MPLYPREFIEQMLDYRETHSARETSHVFDLTPKQIRDFKYNYRKGSKTVFHRNVTTEEVVEAILKYPDYTQEELASLLGCSRRIIHQAIKDSGVKYERKSSSGGLSSSPPSEVVSSEAKVEVLMKECPLIRRVCLVWPEPSL